MSGHRDEFTQKFKNAQKASALEREYDAFKKERERFETRVDKLLGEKERLNVDLERRCDEVTRERDELRIKVIDLETKLAAGLQAKGEVNASGYARGFSHTVSMFRGRFPRRI